MVVATSDGSREVRFPGTFKDTDGGPALEVHQLDMKFGETRLFQRQD
jgi:hypothetical protein